MAERLQKFLAGQGVASRRKSEDLIRAGRVFVDGKKATIGMSVEGFERIEVDGRAVGGSGAEAAPRQNVTYMLYKPKGVISTVKDTHGRETIMQFVPKIAGLHPVGRLDAESEGLILLSTNGDLTLQMTHPRYQHKKEYRVWCREGGVAPAALQKLLQGVKLEDGVARAVKASPIEGGCIIVLGDGRNRQVRRMLEAVGYKVVRLKRTKLNDLGLGRLSAGNFRELKAEDFKKLQLHNSIWMSDNNKARTKSNSTNKATTKTSAKRSRAKKP